MARTITITDHATNVRVSFVVESVDADGTPHISSVTLTAEDQPLQSADLLVLNEIGLPLPVSSPKQPGRSPKVGPGDVLRAARVSPTRDRPATADQVSPPTLDLGPVGPAAKGGGGRRGKRLKRPPDHEIIAAFNRFDTQTAMHKHFGVTKGTFDSWVQTLRRYGALPPSRVWTKREQEHDAKTT